MICEFIQTHLQLSCLNLTPDRPRSGHIFESRNQGAEQMSFGGDGTRSLLEAQDAWNEARIGSQRIDLLRLAENEGMSVESLPYESRI